MTLDTEGRREDAVERLPFEDFDAGLVLHTPDRRDLYEVRSGLDGEVSYFLPVKKFLAMQKERDEYRKALALINAVVTPTNETEASPICDRRIITLLRHAGFSADDGRAMQSLITSIRREAEDR